MTMKQVFAFLLVGIMVVSLPLASFGEGIAGGVKELPEETSGGRWQEYSRGISILPPLNSQIIQRTADSALARILVAEGYQINLFVKEARVELTLPMVRREALEQMGKIYPGARLLSDRTGTVGPHKMISLHFLIPKNKQTRWVTAQTFIELDEQTYLLFQLETSEGQYDLAKLTYEAVIQSLLVKDPDQLAQQRQKLIEAGHTLQSEIPYEAIRSQLIGEQWLRFIEGDRDIGYLRIRQWHGDLDQRLKNLPRHLAQPGFTVEVLARMEINDALYDTISICFLADDQQEEIWSIRTTERPVRTRTAKQLYARQGKKIRFDIREVPIEHQKTWVETGIRTRGQIELTRRQVSSDKQYQWQVPPKSYLSQAELYLLPLILKDRPDGQWGFYAYHANDGKIAFRTERIEHQSNGRFKIYSRLKPQDINEQVTEYDAKGGIIQRILPGGRKLIRATQRQIVARWPQFVR